jgi:hypothetical protein
MIKNIIDQDLAQIIQSTNKLSPAEQLQLIAHLTNNIRDNGHKTQKRYSWHDIRGLVPDPFFGEEAQDWVSRTRQGESIERIRHGEEMALEPVAKRDESCLEGGGLQLLSHKARGGL